MSFVSEKGGDYQSVKTLNYIAPTTGLVSGAQKFHQPPSDETQSDGVGIFAKFRGTCTKYYMYTYIWSLSCYQLPHVHVHVSTLCRYMYICSYMYCTCMYIYTMYV